MARIIAAALAAAWTLAAAAPVVAGTAKAIVVLAAPNGVGGPAGRVMFRDAPGGATIKVDVYGLPPGAHGFHVHDNPSCAAGSVNGVVIPAGAAGSHYDPGGTGKHMGPMGMGHLGDLPVINTDRYGSAHIVLVAPRITDVSALKGHSVVIHAGGDNYSDDPSPNGGGGARIACGVID
jgi:Cu-Zn family superoxide dismutase